MVSFLSLAAPAYPSKLMFRWARLEFKDGCTTCYNKGIPTWALPTSLDKGE